MDLPTPHQLLGHVREVWWSELTSGVPIELELVDYFHAPVIPKQRGLYVIYYCLAVSDYPDLGILSGDKLNFHLSFKCFLNALRKLRSDLVIPCLPEHAMGKNLYIKFEKVSDHRITVHTQDIREPTEAQLLESKKQYAFILEEHKELIKGGNKR